jgi:NAD(P)-dependent dehydrogenase (short-subunit alcohol dehydrogenase family)
MINPKEAVVITGASSGIGAATAYLLARNGFIVFAGVRKATDAALLVARHHHIRPVHLDVADSATIEAAAQKVAADSLVLRGLVNNAGIAIGGPLEFLPVDRLRKQLEVNVIGAVAVSQAFLPQLRAHRGRLVFVGSVSGRFAAPFVAPYSASKFALRAIADAFRIELAPSGIRVALIEPGNVNTPIWRKARDSRERLLELLGPEARELYRYELDAVFRGMDQNERTGMRAETVSRAIHHALVARRPKTHYPLGAGAHLAGVIGLLPAFIQDRLLFRSTSRKRKS